MAGVVTLSTPPAYPAYLNCTVSNGYATLSWPESAQDVSGYNVYKDGKLIWTTPYVKSNFSFPFLNDSSSERKIVISEFIGIERTFSCPISPRVRYVLGVRAYNDAGESKMVSVTVYYETLPTIKSIKLNPNPVFVTSKLIVSALVEERLESTVTNNPVTA